MNDKLKQRFEEIIKGMSSDGYSDGADGLINYIINLMHQAYAEAEQDKWVSVLERTPDLLPDKDYSENVYVVINGQLGIGCFCRHYEFEGENNGYYWANCDGNIDGDAEWDDDYEVTFWQPLPTLPLPKSPQPK